MDAVIVTPPHQQVVFESPVSSRTNSIQSAISNRLVTESKGHAAQVKPSLDGSSVAPREQHRRNEAEDVNDGARNEVNKPAPNVSFAVLSVGSVPATGLTRATVTGVTIVGVPQNQPFSLESTLDRNPDLSVALVMISCIL